MEYTLNEKKALIDKVLSENGLTLNDLSGLFLKQMTSSSEIRREKTSSGISYDRVSSFFTPTMEEIDIENIAGLEYKSGSFYNCLLNIYRPESIFDNLGKFDKEKFQRSLNITNFKLIEKDGKYYVHGDGNHRVLLMLFQYYTGLARLKRLNAPPWMIHKYINSFKITAPVIHLNHKESLLKFLDEYNLETFDGFEQDFINSFLEKNSYRSISYDKDSNTYSICYKGFKKNDLTPNETLETLASIEKIKCKNNIFYNDHRFILFNKHFGLMDIPGDHVMRCDQIISNLKLPNAKFPYFIDGSYYGEKFDLCIGNSFYTDKISNIREINRFIEDNLDVLKADRVEDIYEPANSIYEKKYQNLPLEEIIKIVNIYKKLEDLILVNEVKKNTKK